MRLIKFFISRWALARLSALCLATLPLLHPVLAQQIPLEINEGDEVVSSSDVVALSGETIAAGSVGEVLGVVRVAEDVAPSGFLVSIDVDGSNYLVDYGAFFSSASEANYLLAEPVSLSSGSSAELCMRLWPQPGQVEPDLNGIALDIFLDVEIEGEATDDFSYRLKGASERDDDIDNQFCVSNLPFEKSVEVTLKAGLGFNNDAAPLSSDISISSETLRRTPQILLDASSFYILPADEQGALPISLVNIETLQIEVFKVDPRSIASTRDLLSSRNGWGLSDLARGSALSLGTYELEISSEPSQEVSYNLDLDRILSSEGSGFYIVAFNSPELNLRNRDQRPMQWLVRSDVGASFYSGLNTASVYLNDFATLEPVGAAWVQVVAKNNRILFEGSTNSEGYVAIEQNLLEGEGAHAPRYLVATTTDGDFSYLALDGEQNVPRSLTEGASRTLNEDVYLSLARDMVRPGEILDVNIIARTLDLSPLADFDLDIVLVNGSGSDALTQSITTNTHGLATAAINVASSSALGRYSVQVRRKDGEVLSRAEFNVDDFVPLTIDVAVGSLQDIWNPADRLNAYVEAEYFSGGQASGLEGTLTAQLRSARVIEDLDDYVFGPVTDGDANSTSDPIEFVLPTEGRFETTLSVDAFDEIPDGVKTISLRGEVFDIGGRPNFAVLELPVDDQQYYLGVRSNFGPRLEDNGQPSFSVGYFDRLGTSVERGPVNIRLERLNYRYDWYYSDGGWRWRSVLETQDPLFSEQFNAGEILIPQSLSWGRYRLTADDSAGAVTELDFRVGWGGADSVPSEPSELQVEYHETSLGRSEIRFEAPFDGIVRVHIAGTDIMSEERYAVEQGAASVPVDLPDGIEPGVNILVTLTRPVERGTEHLPQLALGRVWVPILSETRDLNLALETDLSITSVDQITVDVRADDDASVQLFLIDEGIHALSGYRNQDPADHFYAPRALNMEFFSNFGRLIRQDDSLETFSVGGDDNALERVRALGETDFFDTVVLASPILSADRGRVSYSFDAPEMEGSFRLVAIAASADGLGYDELNVQAQDPISIDVSLPRFAVWGDEISGALQLRANDGGQIDLTLRAGETEQRTEMSLPTGEALNRSIVIAPEALQSSVPVSINLNSDLQSVTRSYSLAARAPSLAHYESYSLRFVDGTNDNDESARYSVSGLRLEEIDLLDADGLYLSLNFSPLPGVNIQTALQSVSTSGAWRGNLTSKVSLLRGQIFASRVQGAMTGEAFEQISELVEEILELQRSNGAFANYNWSDASVSEEWQPYAVETLLFASEYLEQTNQIERAIDNGLRYLANQRSEDIWTQLYTLGVLAETGRDVLSRARYLIDSSVLNDTELSRYRYIDRLNNIAGALWLADKIGDYRRYDDINRVLNSLIGSEINRQSDVAGGAPRQSWRQSNVFVPNVGTFRAWETIPWYTGHLLADIGPENRTEGVSYLMMRSAAVYAERSRSPFSAAKLLQILNSFDGGPGDDAMVMSIQEVSVNGVAVPVTQRGDVYLSREDLHNGFELEVTPAVTGYLNLQAIGTRSSREPIGDGFRVRKSIFDENGTLVFSNVSVGGGRCTDGSAYGCASDELVCRNAVDWEGFWDYRNNRNWVFEAEMRGLTCGLSEEFTESIPQDLQRRFNAVDEGLLAMEAVQGETFTVVLTIEKTRVGEVSHSTQITDLLPAGFEFVRGPASLPDVETLADLVEGTEERYRPQFEDDRLVTNLGRWRWSNTNPSRNSLSFAYVIQARNIGSVTIPDALIEDLEDPTIFGRSQIGSATIRPQ
ncbi:hypothetical protein FZCC0069_08990 [Rhodobacterales bacterium FZCC0069]|nr:hypothetical protein [Rhodobacterales bacterium FZCC0069]